MSAALLAASDASESRRYRGRSIGEPTQEQRDAAKVSALIRRAVAIAAKQKPRLGTPRSERYQRIRADAAQDATLAALEDGRRLTLADLIDPDRPTIPSGDGAGSSPRPHPLLVEAAGASIGAALRAELEALPADLLEASDATLDRSNERRSEAASLKDPAADPAPPLVADALDAAGIWPADPLRLAAVAEVTDLVADDFRLVAGYGAGKTHAAVAKALQRGRARLHTGRTDSTVAALGAALRERNQPTPDESEEAAAGALRAIAAGEGRPHHSAASLPDPAWRTEQPHATPLEIRRGV